MDQLLELFSFYFVLKNLRLEFFFFFFPPFIHSLRFALGLSKMRQSTDIADTQHVSFGMKCSSVHHSSMSVAFMTGVTLFVFGSLVIEVSYVMYKTLANSFWWVMWWTDGWFPLLVSTVTHHRGYDDYNLNLECVSGERRVCAIEISNLYKLLVTLSLYVLMFVFFVFFFCINVHL